MKAYGQVAGLNLKLPYITHVSFELEYWRAQHLQFKSYYSQLKTNRIWDFEELTLIWLAKFFVNIKQINNIVHSNARNTYTTQS